MLSHTGLKLEGVAQNGSAASNLSHLLVERQYCPSKQPSPDSVLVGLVCGGYVEQLRWFGPGSTPGYGFISGALSECVI